MRILDKSRPYGTVCGGNPDIPGGVYQQDGYWFKASGEQCQAEPVSQLIEPVSEPITEPIPEKPKKTRKPRASRRTDISL